MRGVTQATYDGYRIAHGKPKQTVREITEIELMEIYRGNYWAVIRGDDLPAGIDYAVFDAAVNSGPIRAAKWLQEAIGVTDDGHIGMITLGAAAEANAEAVIKSMLEKRMTFLMSLSTWGTFGRGWKSRVDGVRRDAIAMAAALASPVQPEHLPEAIPEPPASETVPSAFLDDLRAVLRKHGVV